MNALSGVLPATVQIFTDLSGLTAGVYRGAVTVRVPGATLGEVVEALETRYPGLQTRLVEGERIRPGLAVFVEGVQASFLLSTRLSENAEIYFAPAVAGGSCP